MPYPPSGPPVPVQREGSPAHPVRPTADSGRASLETAKRTTEATPPYPCGVWRLRNRSTGEVLPFRCQRWTCPACSPYLVSRWSRLIDQAPIQRHLVFTALAPDAGSATARLRNIVKGIRRGEATDRPGPRTPTAFEYFCALEGRTEPGYHAHLLTWGDYLPQRSLSRLLGRYGAGTVCWARAIHPHEQTAAVRRYVVTHLVGKVHPDQPKVGRRVRYSRRFWRGETVAQLAARLWPPDPADRWELLKPDLDLRQADKELRAEARRAYYEDRRITRLLRQGWTVDALINAGEISQLNT